MAMGTMNQTDNHTENRLTKSTIWGIVAVAVIIMAIAYATTYHRNVPENSGAAPTSTGQLNAPVGGTSSATEPGTGSTTGQAAPDGPTGGQLNH